MEVRDLAFTVVDVIAAHNLADYIKPGEDKARIITGITLGALGYGLGPALEERIRSTDSVLAAQIAKEDLIYAASGAVAGGIIGYVGAKHFAPEDAGDGPIARRIRQLTQEDTDPKRPSGLVLVASAGYLGYSMLVADHSPEFKQRQRWGLGAGALGYLTGPEALNKLQDLVIPDEQANNGLEIYRRGSAVIGSVLGAGGALWLKKRRENNRITYLPREDRR